MSAVGRARIVRRLTVAQCEGLRIAVLTGGVAFLHHATTKTLALRRLGRRVGAYRFEINARGVFVWQQSLLKPEYRHRGRNR